MLFEFPFIQGLTLLLGALIVIFILVYVVISVRGKEE